MPAVIECALVLAAYLWLTANWLPSAIAALVFLALRMLRHEHRDDLRELNFFSLAYLLLAALLPAVGYVSWQWWQKQAIGGDVTSPLVALPLALILHRLSWYFALNPELLRKKQGEKAIIIYGAGTVARSLLQEIRSADLANQYRIAAFVDNDPAKIGSRLGPYQVFAGSQLPELVARYNVREIWFTMPPSAELMQQTMDSLQNFVLQYKIVPRKIEHILPDIRNLKIEDLVRRNEIKLDPTPLKTLLQGKRVLVTGAAGSIGSEIARQVLQYEPARLTMLDQWEFGIYSLEKEFQDCPVAEFIIADTRDANRMRLVIAGVKPEIIFHAAAYKHVPLMELNYPEAVRTNILGTWHLLDAAAQYLSRDKDSKLRFVNISTDKAVAPENMMGLTKRISELLVFNITQELKELQNRFQTVSVRFGNVLGSSGSVVPLFWEQIARGGPLTVTHPEMERFFMTIPEAVNLVLHALPVSSGNDILALDMGRPVKILELAERLILLSGKLPHKDIKIVFTGMRPGEKLKEELFWQKNSVETSLPFIFRSEADLKKLNTRETIAKISDALKEQHSLAWFKDFLRNFL